MHLRYNYEVLTIASVDLVLGNDDLTAVAVVCARNRVLEEADSPDDLALLNDSHLPITGVLASTKVAWVADDLLCLDGLSTACHADKFAIRVCDNLVDLLVKHVCTAVDGTETRERLGKLSETVEGVDVGRFAVAGHRRRVKDDSVVRGARRLRNVADRSVSAICVHRHCTCNLLVVQVQSHGMPNEVLGTGLETELLINGLHAISVKIDA